MRARVLSLAFLAAVVPFAVSAADDGTDAYIELFRSDLRADKQAIVTYAMDLSDADSKLFWPIYKAYEAERTKLGDRTVDLIRKYPDAVEVTGPDTIRDLAAEWFKVPIPLWKQRSGGLQKLKLLPETASISFNQTTTRSFIYKRGLNDPVGAYALQNDIDYGAVQNAEGEFVRASLEATTAAAAGVGCMPVLGGRTSRASGHRLVYSMNASGPVQERPRTSCTSSPRVISPPSIMKQLSASLPSNRW